MNVALSRVGYLLMALGTVALVASGLAFSPTPVVVVAQLAAAAVMAWARLTFGRRSFHATATPTEGGLVTTGPYRYVRNPIYASVCLFAWAAVVGHPSARTAGLALVVSLGAAIRIMAEEPLLRATYPEYAAYAARTRRLIPFVF